MFDEIFDIVVDAAEAAGELVVEVVKDNGPHIAHAIGEAAKTILK